MYPTGVVLEVTVKPSAVDDDFASGDDSGDEDGDEEEEEESEVGEGVGDSMVYLGSV